VTLPGGTTTDANNVIAVALDELQFSGVDLPETY
jgi:hypothetical protein